MHRITTPLNPVTVETAVTGVSTPSSIGQVRPADGPEPVTEAYLPPGQTRTDELVARLPETEDEPGGYVVIWVNEQGQERWCGKAGGGISAESVVRLIKALSKRNTLVFNVVRVR